MLRSNIDNCAIPVWYQHFRTITFESLFVHLPPDFLTYLQADKVVLPASLLPPQPPKPAAESDSEEEEDEEEWEELPTESQPNFPELEALLRQAIDRLGGEVFVKLNWSAPKDASWMLHDGTLCCRCPLDVILLLKGSEFVQHDLTQAFVECTDGQSEVPRGGFTLALRRYENLAPAGEFRLFVRGRTLLAASQRHHRQFLPSLPADRVHILNDLQQFFFSYLQGRFPDPDFVVDVYRAAPRRVLLVDFNPYSRVTDPLLYSWTELNEIPAGAPPVLRIVETEEGLKGHPYSGNRVPQEVLNVGSQQEINDFVQMFNNGHFTTGDSDDDDL